MYICCLAYKFTKNLYHTWIQHNWDWTMIKSENYEDGTKCKSTTGISTVTHPHTHIHTHTYILIIIIMHC